MQLPQPMGLHNFTKSIATSPRLLLLMTQRSLCVLALQAALRLLYASAANSNLKLHCFSNSASMRYRNEALCNSGRNWTQSQSVQIEFECGDRIQLGHAYFASGKTFEGFFLIFALLAILSLQAGYTISATYYVDAHLNHVFKLENPSTLLLERRKSPRNVITAPLPRDLNI